MTTENLADVWEFEPGIPVDLVIRAALARVEEPTLRARVLRTTGDTLTIEVVSGTLTDPQATLYVERRGSFRVARVEPWGERRVLLVLRAWPLRD